MTVLLRIHLCRTTASHGALTTGTGADDEEGGIPVAAFDASTCDPGEFFQAQQMVLNIDLCGMLHHILLCYIQCLIGIIGDWAGTMFSSESARSRPIFKVIG
jgi:hypothetical protein